jgi:formate dehydrogenase maturation protein FdhE
MWVERAARARHLADRYPATRAILLFYAELAEWQGTAAARRLSPEQALPELAELVRRAGPPDLARAANGLTGLPDLDAPPPGSFFALAARQPSAACGAAHSLPQAGCLETLGEGQALRLVCSLCLGHWDFPRLQCPACGEAGEGRLGLYSAPEFPHLQIQACETCHAYLQLVDLTREPAAIPEVDELTGLPLDLWAQEHGYHKVHPNLAGI